MYEMIDEEGQRKVAEKDEESAKVSKGLDQPLQDENSPIINELETPAKSPITLKYSYKENQWRPLNPEGKMQYNRAFLLELQQQPMSQKRPKGLPNVEVIRDNGGGRPRSSYGNRSGGSGMVNKPMGNLISHDFTPNYFNTKGQGPPSRSPMRGRTSQQGGRRAQQQMQQRKVFSLSQNQDVKPMGNLISHDFRPNYFNAQGQGSPSFHEPAGKSQRAATNAAADAAAYWSTCP